MRVVIVGAGAAGQETARRLSAAHDVVLIDRNEVVTEKLSAEFDCQLLTGNATSLEILEQAGVGKAGLFLAVSGSDEVNLVACQLARHCGAAVTGARLGALENARHVLSRPLAAVDFTLRPEQEVAAELLGSMGSPAGRSHGLFADGTLELQAAAAEPGETYSQVALRSERVVIGVVRRQLLFTPGGETRVEEGDEVFLLGKAGPLPAGPVNRSISARRLLLAGGGGLSLHVASVLRAGKDAQPRIQLIERDPGRAEKLSMAQTHSEVLLGDVTERGIVEKLRLTDRDVFAALSDNDSENVFAALLAKAMGAGVAVVKATCAETLPVARLAGVERVVYPAAAAARAVLSRMKGSCLRRAVVLREGAAYFYETEVCAGSPLDGARLADLSWPETIKVCALVSPRVIWFPEKDQRIQAGSRLLLLSDKEEDCAIFSGLAAGPKPLYRIGYRGVRL
jgi:trk system potassium uptake protein